MVMPFLSLSALKEKRHPLSLFTKEELRMWSKMNGFHYIEDDEVWLNKHNERMITDKKSKRNFHIRGQYPFVHKNNPKIWYERLKFDAYSFKIDYIDVFVYDIKETTLYWQKEQREFYSLWFMNGIRYNNSLEFDDDCIKAELIRTNQIEKIYDIKDRCWISPKEEKYSYWTLLKGFD